MMELISSSREDCVFTHQRRYLDDVCAESKIVAILNTTENGSFMKIFTISKLSYSSLVFRLKVTNEEN